MGNDPVDLDEHRGYDAKLATEYRRKRLYDIDREKIAFGLDRNEFGPLLLGDPAVSWFEVAIKARYLLSQYAQTQEGQSAVQSRLIERTLDDLVILMRESDGKGL